MRIYSLFYLIFGCISIVFTMCSCKSKRENGSPCFQPYTIGELFKYYDSSKFVIHKYNEKTEIWDTSLNNKHADGSFYVFDKHNNLNFYAFLEDSSGAYSFGVAFDSLGNVIKKTGNDVIRWYIKRKGKDSLTLTFLMLRINRSYGKLKLKCSDFSIHPVLLNGIPSNTVGGGITISKRQKEMIYLSGIIRDDCTLIKRDLLDSIKIPSNLTD